MTTRLKVLDFWRGLAIFCVLIDHLFAWISVPTEYIYLHKYFIFSVAPLFFLAGITFALSWNKRPLTIKNTSYRRRLKITCGYYWHKVHSLLFSYLAVTLITLIWNHQPLSLNLYFDNLLAFKNQFYFILIYLQLLAIAPILAHYIKKFCHFGSKKHSNASFWLFSVIIFIISLICNQLPVFSENIFWPGRLLFGGIELFIFYIGQVIGFFGLKYLQPDDNLRPIYILLAIFMLFGLNYTGIINLIFSHPPSFATLSYCVALSLLVLACYQACKHFLPHLTKLTTVSGQSSLIIFLYHGLIIEKILHYYPVIHTYPVAIQFCLLFGLTLTFCLLISKLSAIIQAKLICKL